MAGCTYLTEDQVVEVFDYFGTKQNALRNQTMLMIGVTTGLRISDILNLKIRDVAFKDCSINEIAIKDIIRIKTVKTERSIELNVYQAIKILLKKYIQELWRKRFRGGHRFLFPSPCYRQAPLTIRRAQMLFNHAAEALHISGQISTHTLRKTFARQVYYKLRSLDSDPWPVLMVLLDHTNIATTQMYLSFLFTRDDKRYLTAFEKWDGCFAVYKSDEI